GTSNVHPRELENANAVGEAILSTIHGQRDRLKSAHRKALDVLNTVGISNSVLRLIERRNSGDQWIKYEGMLLTSFSYLLMFCGDINTISCSKTDIFPKFHCGKYINLDFRSIRLTSRAIFPE
ncbi:Membrin-11, partial [Glycine soja]